jgi:hypothetical protein
VTCPPARTAPLMASIPRRGGRSRPIARRWRELESHESGRRSDSLSPR